jgi:hypothetical protein
MRKKTRGLNGPGYSGAIIKRGQAYKTPSQCIVHSVELERDGAVVAYRCGPTGRADEQGNSLDVFPTHMPRTKRSYPSLFLKGVRTLKFRGAEIQADDAARIGFVLSPAAATCEKRMGDIHMSCKLVGDTSSTGLAGTRRRAKSRR